MSEGLNRATLVGHLGADPELQGGGTAGHVLRLRIAVNERVKRDGEWQDHVEWFTAKAFGKRAEGLAPHLRKGSAVLVEGPLRTS